MKPITIEQQKQLLLDMMKDIDAFCGEHELRYFLTTGSLLGAIRHDGYIPWDDDIDIVMPRKDYEIFIHSYTSTHPYQVLSMETDSNFYLSFAKVIAKNTLLQEPIPSGEPIGVYIDIFPLDNLSDSYETAKAFFLENQGDKKKLELKNLMPIKERAWYKNVVIAIVKPFIFSSRQELLQRIDQRSRRYESDSFTKYIGVTCSGIYGEHEIMESSWYENYEYHTFENTSFRIPSGYDKILSQFYGDYLQLLPKEKQVSHHVYSAWWKEDEN